MVEDVRGEYARAATTVLTPYTTSIFHAYFGEFPKNNVLREAHHIPRLGLLTEFQMLGVTEGDDNDERDFLGVLGGLDPNHGVDRSLSVDRRNAGYGHLATISTEFA
jgi:hypothetical protein